MRYSDIRSETGFLISLMRLLVALFQCLNWNAYVFQLRVLVERRLLEQLISIYPVLQAACDENVNERQDR